MNIGIPTTNQHGIEYAYEYRDIPEECPFCHSSIRPIVRTAYSYESHLITSQKIVSQAVFQCPRGSCHNIFVGQFTLRDLGRDSFFSFDFTYPIFPKEITFSKEINEISKNFVEIYNQAYASEQYNLTLISGPGYRKSLEFLIKDYAIKNADESEREAIIKKYLGPVIEGFIDDIRIKSMARRAAWLGNDETHYSRKWVEKDITELKTLIELTVRWIEMVELSRIFEEDMPDH